MKCLLSSLLILSVSLTATSASALIIDDFTIGQGALSATNAIPDVNGVGQTFTPGPLLGFERDVRLQRFGTGSFPSSVVFFSPPNPYVQITTADASGGVNVTFQWDGFADGVGAGKNILDPTGITPTANLIGPGSNLISVTASNGASPATAEFTIRDSADLISVNTLTIPANFAGDLQFLFEDFDTPINFSQSEALQLKLTVAPGTTFFLTGVVQSEYIFFGIPEPSTGCLLLPLVLGLARLRRRNGMAKRS